MLLVKEVEMFELKCIGSNSLNNPSSVVGTWYLVLGTLDWVPFSLEGQSFLNKCTYLRLVEHIPVCSKT